MGRTAGNVILNGNGCPVPPPVPSLLLFTTPHEPSSPAPLSLSLSRQWAVFTAPTLNPCLLSAVSVAEIENSVVLLRHPWLQSTAEPRPRRTRTDFLSICLKKGRSHWNIFSGKPFTYMSGLHQCAGSDRWNFYITRDSINLGFYNPSIHTHTHTSTPSPSFSKQLEEEGVAQKAIDYSWRDGEFGLPLPIRQGAGLHSLG